MALFQMLKMGYRKATLRGCVSAVKACVVMGWLPELQWARLWRFTKAPMDPEAHRPYGGPDVLQIVAEACSSVSDWITYAGCVLSFSSLTRVGEVSSARMDGVGKSHYSFRGLKRGERWVTRQLGPYAAVWARWLRRVRPGTGTILGSAADPGKTSQRIGTSRSTLACLETRGGNVRTGFWIAMALRVLVGQVDKCQDGPLLRYPA